MIRGGEETFEPMSPLNLCPPITKFTVFAYHQIPCSPNKLILVSHSLQILLSHFPGFSGSMGVPTIFVIVSIGFRGFLASPAPVYVYCMAGMGGLPNKLIHYLYPIYVMTQIF